MSSTNCRLLFANELESYEGRLENGKKILNRMMKEKSETDEDVRRAKRVANELHCRIQLLKDLNDAAKEAKDSLSDSREKPIFICTKFLKKKVNDVRFTINGKSIHDSINAVDANGNSKLSALVEAYKSFASLSSVSEKDIDNLMIAIGEYLLFHREQYIPLRKKKTKEEKK